MDGDEGQQAPSWASRALDWASDHAEMLWLTLMVTLVAVMLHLDGITWGDDWTLYLRQAQSLFEGNIGEVIADNHFNVDNAARPTFSPYVYPWGYPLLMAPVLRAVGLDYAVLKLVGVAAFVVFLWAFHAVVRRRMDRWPAFGVVAVVGTTLAYLRHTGYLLSELPYMASVALTLWFLDHLRRRRPLIEATRGQLVALGLAAVWVFNVRREGIAVIAAIVVAQLVELWPQRRQWRTLPWRRISTPLAAFAGGVVAFQLLLPSALMPSYDDAGLHQTWRKLRGPFHRDFAEQLGMPELGSMPDLRTALLWGVFLLAVGGVVLRVFRAPRWDGPLAVFAIGSMTAVGTIPALSQRYLMAITPFAVYFAAQALAAIPLPRRAGRWLAVGALALLTLNHLTTLPSAIDSARRFNASGRVLDGPAAPDVEQAFQAVRERTHEDDVIAFFKVRALTFFTGRRGVQSSDLEILRERSDYYLMRLDGRDGPFITPEAADGMGWHLVWQNEEWVLWRLPLRYPGLPPATMGDA